MTDMTGRQAEALDLIVEFFERNARPITFRELAKALGTKSTNSAHDFLVQLRRKGYVREDRKIIPTELGLHTVLGPRCPYCTNGRVSPPERLRLVP